MKLPSKVRTFKTPDDKIDNICLELSQEQRDNLEEFIKQGRELGTVVRIPKIKVNK